jgi:hypothetical protein
MNGFGLDGLCQKQQWRDLGERRLEKMKSLTAAVVGGLFLTHGFMIRAGSAQDARISTAMQRLVLDVPLQIAVKSQDVRWKGSVYNLVQIGKAKFHLDGSSYLTA